MCGSGVGAMILTPITTAIISDMGWRTAYMFFAALALLLLPLTVYAFVGTPEEKGYPPVNVDTHKRIAQSKRVLEEKTGNYHKNGLLCLAFVGILILAGTSQTWNTSASAYLTGIGFDPVTTTSVLSISAFFVIIGKLGLGAICDRWGARASIYIGGGSICLTYAILLIVEYVPALVFLAAATIGIGMSVVTIGIPVLCSDLLSDRPYQSSVGYLNVASNLGGATLPLTIAAIYDTTQHYGLAWSYATTIAFGAVILICIAYRKKSQTTLLCQK